METNGNGHSDGTIYVKFGPGKTQEIPIEWAAFMLAKWRESNRLQFGRALAEAANEAK